MSFYDFVFELIDEREEDSKRTMMVLNRFKEMETNEKSIHRLSRILKLKKKQMEGDGFCVPKTFLVDRQKQIDFEIVVRPSLVGLLPIRYVRTVLIRTIRSWSRSFVSISLPSVSLCLYANTTVFLRNFVPSIHQTLTKYQ